MLKILEMKNNQAPELKKLRELQSIYQYRKRLMSRTMN